MASGIKVDECGIEAYADLKLKREKGSRPFALSYKIAEGDTCIVLDKKYGRPGADVSQEVAFALLVEDLPSDDGRYVVVDLCVEAAGGETKIDRIVLIVWVPDSAAIKKKMMYSSSLRAFKEKTCMKDHIQANDKSDLTYGDVTSKVSKKK